MNQDEMNHDEIEEYGDPGIASRHAPVPKWLIATYAILPVLGIIAWVVFWNGSLGYLDRGYWASLQKAANTTFPEIRDPGFQFDNPE